MFLCFNVLMNMNYTNYNPNQRPYNPKAAVKNFTDLDDNAMKKAITERVDISEIFSLLKKG